MDGYGDGTFRPRKVLVLLTALSGCVWGGLVLYLLRFGAVPVGTLASAMGFLLFFSAACAYYSRAAIVLDSTGLTYRGLVRTRRLPYRDISKVEILDGPVTVYSVLGNRQCVYFTSFFRNHRLLARTLARRVRLEG